MTEPPVALPSPQADRYLNASPSPVKEKRDSEPKAEAEATDENISAAEDLKARKAAALQEMLASPTKIGKKRKLATRDEPVLAKPVPSMAQENQPLRVISGKPLNRAKAGGRTLKELTGLQKDSQDQTEGPRKPLSAKSTNDDITSPKKTDKPIKQTAKEDAAAGKPGLIKTSNPQSRARGRPKAPPVKKDEPAPTIEHASVVNKVENDLGNPLAEPELLSPSSPEPLQPIETPLGDTPPPADISSRGETSRPSRRNRTTVSYAEPNLRDKMRRPTKELVDAVVDRRSSQLDLISRDSLNTKHSDSDASADPEPGSIPASPLAKKAAAAAAEFDDSLKLVDKRKRSSAVPIKFAVVIDDQVASQDVSSESISTDVDVYDVTDSSPQPKKQPEARRKPGSGKSSRRFSSAVENEDGSTTKERMSSRRRSMMV